MAKDESRNDQNVCARLYLRKLPIDGASVPQVNDPYEFVVNVFKS